MTNFIMKLSKRTKGGRMDSEDIEGIASRIADIILSPETISGLINGALTVPLDLGYLARGLFDTDNRFAHQTQRIRMARAIRNDILNYDHIINAVELIFQQFNKYLTVSQQDNIYRAVISSIAGRVATANIASNIAGAVLARLSIIGAKTGSKLIGQIAMILLVGGMSERSVRTSEALAIEVPEVYAILCPHDYDLTYFLIEPAVKPFVDAIHVAATQRQPAFDKIMSTIGEKLHATQ
jgi:hypothetical protein